MIVMPVIVRSDLRWSPYHLYLGRECYLMTSLYYLPKNNQMDVKKYLSGGKVERGKGHFPIDDVENTKVFVDNGAFSLTLKGERLPSPRELAKIFEHRVVGADIVAAGPDVPINLSKFSIDEKIKRAQQTVRNMEEFISAYEGEAEPAAVIQAIGKKMALEQAKAYQRMGYKIVAIGTMGRAVTEELLEQAKAVGNLGLKVHIFGATPPSVLPLLNYYQVDMCDSHSPLRWSMFGQILDPKTYRLKNTNTIKKEDWSCECPVCRENLDRVLNPTTGRIADVRAVHNLLILKKAANDQRLRECVIEAQKHFKKTLACKKCTLVRHIGDCAMKKYRNQCLLQKEKQLIIQ